MERKFKVGDLVRSENFDCIGIITKFYWGNHRHYWVRWNNGEAHTTHERFLEIMSEGR